MDARIIAALVLAALAIGTTISWLLLNGFYAKKCSHIRNTEQSKWANPNSILLRFTSDMERDKFLGLLSSDWTDGVLTTDWSSPPDQRTAIVLDVKITPTQEESALNHSA